MAKNNNKISVGQTRTRLIKRTFILFPLFLALFQVVYAQNELRFGTKGEIVFNEASHTVVVRYADQELVSSVHAAAANHGTELDSRSYSSHTVTISDFTDAIGSGSKMTISFSHEGLPSMHHIFYTYPDKEYFLTELFLSGETLGSNFMSPFVGEGANINATGDNRVLFVPFDNDTFIRYRSKSMATTVTNVSSEVTAFYENNSRNGIVVGSVEFTDWKTGVETVGTNSELSRLKVWGGYTENSVTRDAIPHGSLEGDTIKSPKVFFGFFDDWRAGLDSYAQSSALLQPRYIFDWSEPTPFIWNSWGVIQNHLTAENARGNLNFIANSLPAFRNGETAYIDLDSFWDNMASGGIGGDFSQLLAFVNDCKSKGLKAGIYWTPFVDWYKAPRQMEGSSYNYQDVWTKVNGNYHELDGGRAMDPTHPGTLERIKYAMNRFKLCGFEMIKLDFLGHGAIESDAFYDPTIKTGMQAYRKGMEYLVDQLDGKMLVYAAISPSLASARYCHIRRIACDAFVDIGATEYTLNSTTYGWWQTFMYNYVDGDHVVFANASLGENKARLTSSLVTGTLTIGDDFSKTGQWTDRAKTLLQNSNLLDIARNGEAFKPVEGDQTQSASNLFAKKIGDSYYLAVVNYSSAANMVVDLDRTGIPADDYSVKELFTNQASSIQEGKLTVSIGAKDAAIYRFSTGSVTSTTSEVSDTLELFPNPVTTLVTIKNQYPIRTLKIFSSEGRLMTEVHNPGGNQYEVDMSKYKPGLYYFNVTDSKNLERTFKVIRQK